MKKIQDDISYHEINIEFVSNEALLLELSKLYCSVWTDDVNFNEYMTCKVCGNYFSRRQVEIEGIKTCSGNNNNHEETTLVIAWDPDTVSNEEILGNLKKYAENFYGIYAFDEKAKIIVGFTWAWLEKAQDIKDKWGQDIANKLGQEDSTYYSEIAVIPSEVYRKKGIGSDLCFWLCFWISEAFPENPSFLRTHKNSPARKMFEKAGYRYFADDPQHGDGRIMMKIDLGKNLK